MLKFITDSAALIGATHVPEGLRLQDYTESGILANGSAAFAVTCDGSSCADPETKKPDRNARTDTGARALALATAKAIATNWALTGLITAETAESIRLQQQLALPLARGVLGLSQKDMAATCLYAYVSPEGGVIHIQGDGVLARRKLDGSIHMHRWDWTNNGPFYPSYVTEPDHLASFVKSKGGLDAEALTQQEWLVKGRDFQNLGDRKITVRDGIKGVVIPLSAAEIAETDSLYLISDGICSVCEGNSPMNMQKPLDWKDMVVRMLAMIKHPTDTFVMARLARWLERDTQLLGAIHQDDLSLSSIYFIHEPTTTS